MAYADLYNAADDEVNFQKRCYVAAWIIAQDIAGTPLANTTQARKDWAAKVMAERTNITGRQLAFQLLRHPDVAAALNAATDDQIRIAVLTRLDDLVEIG